MRGLKDGRRRQGLRVCRMGVYSGGILTFGLGVEVVFADPERRWLKGYSCMAEPLNRRYLAMTQVVRLVNKVDLY